MDRTREGENQINILQSFNNKIDCTVLLTSKQKKNSYYFFKENVLKTGPQVS